jgi:hypothetical protein
MDVAILPEIQKRHARKKYRKDVYIVALPWLSRNVGEQRDKNGLETLFRVWVCNVEQLSLHKQEYFYIL